MKPIYFNTLAEDRAAFAAAGSDSWKLWRRDKPYLWINGVARPVEVAAMRHQEPGVSDALRSSEARLTGGDAVQFCLNGRDHSYLVHQYGAKLA